MPAAPLTARPIPRLGVAAAGLVVAIAATVAFDRSGLGASASPTAGLLADLVVWVPLAGAVLVAIAWPREAGATAVLGLRFRAIDLVWGLLVGCAARALSAAIDLALYGTSGLAPQPLVGVRPDAWFVLLGVVAPVLVAPLVEEAFFRGLAQRAATALCLRAMPAPAPQLVSVGVIAVLFGALHTIGIADPVQATYVFSTTLLVGIGAGALTAATGRIGAGLVAHAVFNGIAVALTWPG
jgi:membrane protease YdiL (CAAX protease family)